MRYSFIRDILREPMFIEPAFAKANENAFRVLFMNNVELDPVDSSKMSSMVEVKTGETSAHIHVIELKDVMTREDGWCNVGTRTIAAKLKEMDSDPRVVGHILKIDSGGGAANSVPDLAEAIRSLTKPIVAFVDGYMCSAAMYAGSYCDYIISGRDMHMVGCIGTMIELCDYPARLTELSDGTLNIRVYAAQSTEKNQDYEEALTGNIKLIQENLLNPLCQQFIDDVTKNRPSIKEVELKGRTFFAKDVVGSLVDEIGPMQRAINKIMELSKSDDSATKTVLNQNIITQMELINIQHISSCSQLESQDGMISFNEEQLGDIDSALGEVAKVPTLKSQLAEANSTIATLNSTISDLNTRIEDLKAALERQEDQPDLSNPNHNGNHADKDSKTSTDEEAYASCKQHIQKYRS